MPAHNFVDLTGRKFFKLVVKEYVGCQKGQGSIWRCVCDCGNVVDIPRARLISFQNKSCGCFRKQGTHKATEHGYSRRGKKTPEYICWCTMRQRCNNPNNPEYKWYGARGIKVCERWENFENFYNDMGMRPNGMTLDRYPNKDGDYAPGNCRWATPAEQTFNRRVPNTRPALQIEKGSANDYEIITLRRGTKFIGLTQQEITQLLLELTGCDSWSAMTD